MSKGEILIYSGLLSKIYLTKTISKNYFLCVIRIFELTTDNVFFINVI